MICEPAALTLRGNGIFPYRLLVYLTADGREVLWDYAHKHQVSRAEAVRRAIALLPSDPTPAPKRYRFRPLGLGEGLQL